MQLLLPPVLEMHLSMKHSHQLPPGNQAASGGHTPLHAALMWPNTGVTAIMHVCAAMPCSSPPCQAAAPPYVVCHARDYQGPLEGPLPWQRHYWYMYMASPAAPCSSTVHPDGLVYLLALRGGSGSINLFSMQAGAVEQAYHGSQCDNSINLESP
jgi:hypothetical protein